MFSVKDFALDAAMVAIAAAAAHWGMVPLGVAVILAIELYRRPAGTKPGEAMVLAVPRWLGGSAWALLVALHPKAATKAGLLAAYLGWLLLLELYRQRRLWVAGMTQFLVLWAAFLAAGIWHWPSVPVILLVYGASYLVGVWLLDQQRAARVLSLAWALIVAEAAWVFSVWLVSYIVFRGYVIIPQPAVVLTALGYCFGGIHAAHAQTKLSRGRLAEYLLIGLVLIVIVVAGTKWTGTI